MTEQKRFSKVMKCGHCGNSAPMEIVDSHSEVKEVEDSENNRGDSK